MKILVIAAHPDDEVLGMGGTIKKLSKRNCVHFCSVTDGASAQYKDKKMIKERKNACVGAGKILGIKSFEFLNFPDMQLDTIPHLEINSSLEKVIRKINPEIVYTVFPNDFNKDHQIVFESTLVSARPVKNKIKEIVCYELPGPIRKPFIPNLYEDISKNINHKIKAFKKYKSEVEKFPHPRSIESIESLAKKRGVESNLLLAEAFQLIRKIN